MSVIGLIIDYLYIKYVSHVGFIYHNTILSSAGTGIIYNYILYRYRRFRVSRSQYDYNMFVYNIIPSIYNIYVTLFTAHCIRRIGPAGGVCMILYAIRRFFTVTECRPMISFYIHHRHYSSTYGYKISKGPTLRLYI